MFFEGLLETGGDETKGQSLFKETFRFPSLLKCDRLDKSCWQPNTHSESEGHANEG